MFDRTSATSPKSLHFGQENPQTTLKKGLLSNRLAMEPHETSHLLQELQLAVARTLGVPETAVKADIEFRGGVMDFVYTVHRQNLPAPTRGSGT